MMDEFSNGLYDCRQGLYVLTYQGVITKTNAPPALGPRAALGTSVGKGWKSYFLWNLVIPAIMWCESGCDLMDNPNASLIQAPLSVKTSKSELSTAVRDTPFSMNLILEGRLVE